MSQVIGRSSQKVTCIEIGKKISTHGGLVGPWVMTHFNSSILYYTQVNFIPCTIKFYKIIPMINCT